VFGVRCSGEPRTGVRGWWGLFCSSGFPARVLFFCGTVGGVSPTRSREAAKTRREGRVWRSDQCDGLSFSPFHFLVSTHYGMEAMAPSPPTPLPRFTGARGGFVGEPRTGVRGWWGLFCSSGFPARVLFFCGTGGRGSPTRSREAAKGRRERAVVVVCFRVRVRVPSARADLVRGGISVRCSGEPRTGVRGCCCTAAGGVCGAVLGVSLKGAFGGLWVVWPPHPRPLSPVSRGRGGELWASRGRESAGGGAAALRPAAAVAQFCAFF